MVLIQLRLEAASNLLEQTQVFINAFTRQRFHSRTAEKIALASNELLANAINYGSVSGDVLYVLAEARSHLQVQVSNDAAPARQAMLSRHMQRLAADPEKTLMEELGRSVGGVASRAMLGLARICHEAQMSLELLLEGARVTVIARCAR